MLSHSEDNLGHHDHRVKLEFGKHHLGTKNDKASSSSNYNFYITSLLLHYLITVISSFCLRICVLKLEFLNFINKQNSFFAWPNLLWIIMHPRLTNWLYLSLSIHSSYLSGPKISISISKSPTHFSSCSTQFFSA